MFPGNTWIASIFFFIAGEQVVVYQVQVKLQDLLSIYVCQKEGQSSKQINLL
jgi:hypothetical protein